MRFSYSLLKKLVPEIKSKKDLVEKLALRVFEVDEVEGDTLNVEVYSNRYSSAASHWGLAREIAVVYGRKEPFDFAQGIRDVEVEVDREVSVVVEEPKLCPRMAARYFGGVKIGPSPKWMQKVLVSCGQRPINNLVDITNYVTLETGQPLHVFDADKMSVSRISRGSGSRAGSYADLTLFVRRARKGERVVLLDGEEVSLDRGTLVLADSKEPLDVAGVKGGKKAEVAKRTKNILLTAGNFGGVSVYKTSRRYGVITDASNRFSHNLSPELVSVGMERACELVADLCGAKAGVLVDVYPKKPKRRTIAFNIDRFNKLTGLELTSAQAFAFLKRLGFKVAGNKVSVPILRDDISTPEDLAEEVVRLYGYDKVPSLPPEVRLVPAGTDELVLFKDRVRKFFTGVGFDEVYNHSFVSEEEVTRGNEWDYKAPRLVNSMSELQTHLRPTLTYHLVRNVHDNLRFFDVVRVFEIGCVFHEVPGKNGDVIEWPHLGFAISGEGSFFEVKGVAENLLGSFGLTNFIQVPADGGVVVKSSGKVVGYLNHVDGEMSVGEIDLAVLMELVDDELSFEPLPKYPAVERDVSLVVDEDAKIGDLIQEIQLADVKLIRDVDLVDEYFDEGWEGKQSVTLRIVFQAEDRTLKGKEVDEVIKMIVDVLGDKFGAEVR